MGGLEMMRMALGQPKVRACDVLHGQRTGKAAVLPRWWTDCALPLRSLPVCRGTQSACGVSHLVWKF